MKKHIENYDVFKETISENNVLAMAEQLAMYETRFLIGYMDNKVQKIYHNSYICRAVRFYNNLWICTPLLFQIACQDTKNVERI